MSGSETTELTPTVQAVPVSARLLTDSQFEAPLRYLESFLTRSLELRDDASGLIDLQAEMAGFLISAQDSQKNLKKELDDVAAADKEHSYSPGTLIEVCTRLQRIERQIADGIAWRVLAYDRTMLRILTQKPHTGHMEISSAEDEITQAATRVVLTGDLVVVNDLTNYLRYGDLTAVGDEGVTIYEVKGGKGSAKSGRARRQQRKVEEAVEFIRRGFVNAEEGEKRILDLDTEPVAHMQELGELVSQAISSGSATGRLSDCLFVAVFDSLALGEKVAAGVQPSTLVQNPFAKAKEWDMFDSLGLSTRFTRNVAPYSVFPLSPADRLAIMTGRLWVVCFFNFGNLWRCLRRRDLVVEPPTKEGFDALANLPPHLVAARELDNPLRISRRGGQHTLSIPISALARLFYETLDEECFADRVEEELSLISDPRREPSGSVFLYTGFREEGRLWD